MPIFPAVRLIPADAPDYARRTLRYDFATALLKGVAGVASMATSAVIAKKAFGADDWVIAFLYSSYSVGQIFSVWASQLAGRTGTIRFIVLVESASMGLIVLSAFMASSWGFVLALAGAYALMTVPLPAYSRVYRQNYPTAMRGVLYSHVRIGYNTTTTICGFVVGRLLDVHPDAYAAVYPALGVVGLAGTIVFSRIRIRDEADLDATGERASWRTYWRILVEDPRYRAFLIIWMVFGFANLMAEPIRAIYLTDPRYGVGAGYLESLLILLVIPQATMLLTLRLWGRALDRYPSSILRVWMQVFGGLSLVAFAMTPRIEWLYGAAVFKGLSLAGGEMTWYLSVMEFAPRNRITEYMTIHVLFTGIRGVTAPQVAAALLATIGLRPTFVLGIIGTAISVLLFLVFPRFAAKWPVPAGAPEPRRMPGRE